MTKCTTIHLNFAPLITATFTFLAVTSVLQIKIMKNYNKNSEVMKLLNIPVLWQRALTYPQCMGLSIEMTRRMTDITIPVNSFVAFDEQLYIL